jgi:hypothetical protein
MERLEVGREYCSAKKLKLLCVNGHIADDCRVAENPSHHPKRTRDIHYPPVSAKHQSALAVRIGAVCMSFIKVLKPLFPKFTRKAYREFARADVRERSILEICSARPFLLPYSRY